ncbi:hypothetical protein [Thiomonas sp.]
MPHLPGDRREFFRVRSRLGHFSHSGRRTPQPTLSLLRDALPTQPDGPAEH